MSFHYHFYILSSLLLTLLLSCNPTEELKAPQIADRNLPPSQASNSNTPVKWPAHNFPLKIHFSSFLKDQGFDLVLLENLGESWEVSIDNEIDFFSFQSELTTHPDWEKLKTYSEDNVMGIYGSTTWFPESSSSALAIAYSQGYMFNEGTPHENVQLINVDIILNFRDHNFADDGYDLPSVILHELGHALGLRHLFNAQAVMFPYLGRFTQKRDLADIDTDTIKNLYGLAEIETPPLEILVAPILASAISPPQIKKDRKPVENTGPRRVTIIHELRKNGRCLHYYNGKLNLIHDIF